MIDPLLDFRALIGHRDALQSLRTGGREKPFPSLIFGGPARIGKRLCGVWYAAYLNCLHDDEHAPCGECRSCTKMLHGSHPDIHFTRVPEKKTVIGVSDVREAIHEISHAPFEGRFRIWLIEDGERLSDEAQNALLKTLEEPPRRAVILLVTSLEGTLIPTVSSRCRLLRMGALEREITLKALASHGAEESLAHTLEAFCGGSLGTALSMLREPKLLEEQEVIVGLFAELPGKDLWQAMETAQAFDKMKVGGNALVVDLGLSVYRDLLVLSVGASDLVVHRSQLPRLEQLAARMSAETIHKLLRELQEAGHYLQRNVSPRLVLQRLCMKLAEAGGE